MAIKLETEFNFPATDEWAVSKKAFSDLQAHCIGLPTTHLEALCIGVLAYFREVFVEKSPENYEAYSNRVNDVLRHIDFNSTDL